MLVVETIYFMTVIVITGRWEHALINIHSTRHPRREFEDRVRTIQNVLHAYLT